MFKIIIGKKNQCNYEAQKIEIFGTSTVVAVYCVTVTNIYTSILI
jgi:hypothetical protein